MAALAWPAKDPDEVLDYQLDWSARIADDKIVSSEWIVPDGLTKRIDRFSDTVTTVWLAGGDDDTTYHIVNRITTDVGRIMDQSVKLTNVEK